MKSLFKGNSKEGEEGEEGEGEQPVGKARGRDRGREGPFFVIHKPSLPRLRKKVENARFETSFFYLLFSFPCTLEPSLA